MLNKIIPFNALPILHQEINLTLNNEEKEFFQTLKFNGDSKGVQVTENIFVLNNSKTVRLKNFFTQIAEEYKKQILGINNNICLTSSWLAVNKTNCKHHEHRHMNAFITMVFYIKCESGDLIIKLPKSRLEEGFHFSYDIIETNCFNTNTCELEVKTNSLVIFPGWFYHETKINQSSKDRIILGLNFMVDGQFGSYKNNDLIKFKLEETNA